MLGLASQLQLQPNSVVTQSSPFIFNSKTIREKYKHKQFFLSPVSMATTKPSYSTAAGGDSTEPYDRVKAVKQFDESKIGVKGLVDAGIRNIPQFFVHPPEILSDLKPGPEFEIQIPTVDLFGAESSDHRSAVVNQIRHAASTVGFFQVINHGIPLGVLDRTINSMKAFHEQPTEIKARVYRRDIGTGVSFISNVDLYHSKAASWRDTLQLRMGPTRADEKEIPEVCRAQVIEWDREVKRLAEVLMGLLSEGLGLYTERLRDLTCSEGRVMVGHYYPYCPQPDLTVGLTSHADPGVLTVVLQDHIGGLQVRTSKGWVDVKPIPGALVINIGDLLQILSNEEYKSADHRVLANTSQEARLSVAVFFNPSVRESEFGPLPELTSAEKPPLYRNFTVNEFLRRFFSKQLDGKSLTNYFRL